MAGKNAQKRYHADAIRAVNMKRDGFTTRQIADELGKEPEQIKAILQLGERLIDDTPTRAAAMLAGGKG